MPCRGEMSKRISHAFAVPERKENRTLRETEFDLSLFFYGAPTGHTSATLDFKEWRRLFVFLPRFLLTSLYRTRLDLKHLTYCDDFGTIKLL